MAASTDTLPPPPLASAADDLGAALAGSGNLAPVAVVVLRWRGAMASEESPSAARGDELVMGYLHTAILLLEFDCLLAPPSSATMHAESSWDGF